MIFMAGMTSPAKRITAALKNHAGSSCADQTAALDDMASHNLLGFFGTLFEIDQRLQAESRQPKEQQHENQ
jgi:hypothetical protein